MGPSRGGRWWRPGTSHGCGVRVGLDHLTFQSLRRFVDTYGQDLGFSAAQVALRAGHDPAVAGRYYTGRVSSSDRELAEALSELVSPPEMLD